MTQKAELLSFAESRAARRARLFSLLARARAEGRSGRSLAQAIGVSYSTLLYYQKKRAAAAPAAPRFVEIALEPARSHRAANYELRLPDGTTLVIPSDCEESALRKIITIVRS